MLKSLFLAITLGFWLVLFPASTLNDNLYPKPEQVVQAPQPMQATEIMSPWQVRLLPMSVDNFTLQPLPPVKDGPPKIILTK